MNLLFKKVTGLAAAFVLGVVFTGLSVQAPAQEKKRNYSEYPEVRAFVDRMHSKHGFNKAKLLAEFARIDRLDSVLRSMERPAEKVLTWERYRNIMLESKRFKSGVDFARTHRKTFARAEKEFQVPKEVILAILGVETRYGTIQGKHLVFQSLSTLAFDYPRRSAFFTKELEQLLLLAQEQDFDLHNLRGSYAGAMGYGQFIPSSYRHYAIDFDGDGVKDLLKNPVDAIGSIANYLDENGWRGGEPVAILAAAGKRPQMDIVNKGRKPKYTLSELRKKGFVPLHNDEMLDLKALVLSFELPEEVEYWFAFNNFRSIMSYNPRFFYAMAVHQFSEELSTMVD